MLEWLFKKKKVEEENKLIVFNNNLKLAFSNIRSDIESTWKWISTLNEKDKDFEHKISEISERLARIEGYLINKPEQLPEMDAEEETEEENKDLIASSLTKTHKELYMAIVDIIIASNQALIPLKFIAKKFYNFEDDRKYRSIASTITEYTNQLEETGLIKKVRKGRNTYLILTKKGIIISEPQKRKKLLTILAK